MKIYRILLILILVVSFALRFYKMDVNPPGLYVDEVSIGNNAYDILKTGRDEYGIRFPLFFRSFGDYKMPGYIYLTSASMALFGKNEFAVRFASTLLGSLIILVFYLFVKKLMEIDKGIGREKIEKTALIASFLLAITPWHIQFSRGGFEATVALFFFLLGFVLFLYFYEKRDKLPLFLSVLSFVLSIYTYHVYRIATPITILFLGMLYTLKFPKERRTIFLGFACFVILLLPIAIFSLSPQGYERFAATSAFGEVHATSLIQKLFLYPMALLKNYLSFFSFNFLFDTGDGIGRHQIHNFGPLFKWELPFLLIGIFAAVKLKNNQIKSIIFFLLLISPLAAAFAVPSPHTLRSLPMVIPLTLLIAMGVFYLFERIHRFKKLFIFLLGLVVVYEFAIYTHFYYVHYPKVNDLDWGAGYKELVYETQGIGKNFDYIVIDDHLGYAPIYYNFYVGSKSPQLVGSDWKKPAEWVNKKVLYIRPYYASNTDSKMIYQVYLPHDKNYIFAQFWSL
jgi:4-amino-4-deoxy-L-arabinose transferase-like glycosyltransferase